MNTIPLIILSSVIAFRSETPTSDTLPARVDTAYSLAYYASRGDREAQKMFKVRRKRVFSDDEKKAEMVFRIRVMRAEQPNLRSGSAPVQEIPMQESFSPSGALTYNIPIATIAGHTFSPSISLAYNSQAGNGIAGFGWNITGLSAISLRNKDLYYDGTVAAADYQDKTNAVWTLDGEPLVQNEDISSFPGYQYQTAKGRIMVKKYMSGSDLYSFDARLPDGRMAEYGGELALTQKRISYPISQMQNLSGNVILFYYNTSDYNNPVISEILYGGTCDDNCPGRLVFTYQSGRTDTPARYVAGAEVRQERLLKSITSYDGNNEICTYTLTHTFQDGVWLLTRIDCSRGGAQLNPLLFSYGTPGSEGGGGIALADTTSLGAGYNNANNQDDYIYLRGKFFVGKSDDGIISLKKKDNFIGIPSIFPSLFKSEYPSDSKIYISPQLDSNASHTDVIYTGDWFQTISAEDIDGDGADEIVQVNSSGASSGYTSLQITIYKYYPGFGRSTRIYWVSVRGSKKVSSNYYPYQRAYFFGDFLGNGKCQLLAFCYSKNRYSQSQTQTAALIDLEAGTVISDEALCTCDASDAATIFAADIDGDARFLLTETDPLGLTTTYSNYNVFGKPAQVTDAKGRSTYYTYDGWGALTRTDRPDGSWTASSTQWCGGTEPGLYKVTSEDCTGAMTSIYYDVLGREIQTAGKRFDGQWQCRRKEYDSRGLLSRVSLPYRRSAPADTATALLWNNYLYDVYGRDTCVAEASGRRSRTIYDRTVTTTVRDGITSTATVDALGRTALVHDAGGDIVYSYRPDGNPSSISVHGGVTTTFGYNAFGERCSIDDPSLGLQTDSTAWASDGRSVTTSTNVYGTTRSTSDRYGRLMTVEKIGEDTVTYAYDAYNLLTGLSSTNGTAIAYGYDAYDRLAHETEYHGTDSLRKAYTYNALGQLASKTYTSNFVYMPVTENYSYANGHNTTTTAFIPEVPDMANEMTFTVKQLLSENEFGQPTSVLVGMNTRTYTYNQYGLPTSRSVGPDKTETYSFDANTGNLSQRNLTSAWQGPLLQESFTYDNLGRLSGVSKSSPQPAATSGSTSYDTYSNATLITDAASMQYNDQQHPYTLTSYTAASSAFQKNLTIGHNVDGKPSSIENSNYDAHITYGPSGDRTTMLVHDKVLNRTNTLRHYFGGCMEVYGYPYSAAPGSGYFYYPTIFLGGDYYTAPMTVDFLDEPGEYIINTLWRDYLGSVRDCCVYDTGNDGSAANYDAWGRGCFADEDPTTPSASFWTISSRGFGGHEYLRWFGIYNANARLYDPLLGRFLSPDPYVQAPDFSVNFNRYVWCLNNPLKYTDPDGEFAVETMLLVGGICAAVFGAGNVAAHAVRGDLDLYNCMKYFMSGATAGFFIGCVGYCAWAGATAMTASSSWFIRTAGNVYTHAYLLPTASTAVSLTTSIGNGIFNDNGQWFNNFAKTIIGDFYLDENKSLAGQAWEGFSRHTWEAPQQLVGYAASSVRNAYVDRVDLWGARLFLLY